MRFLSFVFSVTFLLSIGKLNAQTTTYLWSNGATTSTINVNPTVTTTYRVTITSNGVNYYDSLVVSVSSNPVISGSSNVCVGNVIQLTGSGSPATSNAWVTSNTNVATVSSTGLVTGVSAGTTIITYTNSEGCSTTSVITVNSLPTVSSPLSASYCQGYSSVTPLSVSVSGGSFTYQWYSNTTNSTTGATLIAGATSNTYTPPVANIGTLYYYCVVTQSGSGCSTTSAIASITVNPSVTPTFSAVSSICSGGSLAALPTTSNNGITGTWSPALDNTATTIYTFTPDAGQCATTATLTITVNPNVTPTFSAVSPICSGASLSALPTTSNNGITGTWSPALNNTATTTYTFTPTAGQCASTTTMTITVTPTPTVNAGTDVTIYSGNSTTLTATPSTIGGTFAWSNGLGTSSSASVSPTATTTYTVSYTLGSCAAVTDNIQVTVIADPTITATNDTICTGDATTIAISGSSGSTSALSGSLTNGLVGYWPFNGNANDASGNGNNGTVNGATLTTDRFGNANQAYNFDGINDYIEVSNNGNTISDKTFSAWVLLNSLSQSGGGLVSIQTNGGDNFDAIVYNELNNGWMFGSEFYLRTTTSNFSETNSQWVNITFSYKSNEYRIYRNGILIHETLNYNIFPFVNGSFLFGERHFGPLNAFLNAKIDDIGIWNRSLTQQEIQQLYSSDNSTYLWSNGETTSSISVNPTTTTTYTCTVTTNGSSVVKSQTVVVNSAVTPTFTQVSPICSGGSLAALPTTSNNGITGTWSPALNNTATTTYTFTPTAGQCASTATMTITVTPTPTVNAGTDVTIYAGNSTTLTATPSTIGGTFAWSNGLGTSSSVSVNPTTTTTYTVSYTLGSCAAVTDNIQVTVLADPTITATNDTICTGGATTITISGLTNSNSNLDTLDLYNNFIFSALDASSGRYRIWRKDSLNGNYRSLFSDSYDRTHVVLSFDKQEIIYVKYNRSTATPGPMSNATMTRAWVCRNNINGNTETTLFEVPNYNRDAIYSLDWTKDKTKILYIKGNDAYPSSTRDGDVFEYTISNNTHTNTTNDFDYSKQICKYAENTNQIFYSKNLTNWVAWDVHVFKKENASTSPVTVVNGTGYSYPNTNIDLIDVSADGNLVYYRRTGNDYLYSKNISTGIEQLISNVTGNGGIFINNSLIGTTSITNTINVINSTNNLKSFTIPQINEIKVDDQYCRHLGSAGNTDLCFIGKWTQPVTSNFIWSNGATTASISVNPTTTTTYTCTVTTNGVSTVKSQTIVVNSAVTPTFTQVTAICSGATLSALPTTSNNGVTGTWSPALDNTTTTTYTFTPDAGQCATTATLTITVNPNVTPTFSAVSPICSGGSLAALPTTSNNGITGTWSPALDNTTTTTYTFTPDAGQCATTATLTITVNPNVTPTFSAVSPICSGGSLAALPTTSNNGITGTWSPALDNTTTTTYTFTPDAGQCATTATLTITVNPNVTPTFTAVSPICSGATLSALPTTSNNGITGTWSPALNNTATTTYTFTPTAGQCASTTTMTITVNPTTTPTFVQVAPICSGATLSALPTTSNNGITGTWSPALDNTTTTTYTFTPTAGQCASTATMTITVNPTTTPTFTQVAPICSGASLSALPTTSNNGITGTWSPALNNTATTTYTFTPTAGQCASTATMTLTVNALPTVSLNSEAICEGQSAIINATVTPSGTYNYQWTDPDGTFAGTNQASIQTAIPGNYSVQVSQSSTNQIIFEATSPSSIAGTYNFTWAKPTSSWGTPDFNVPGTSIQGELMLVEDGSEGTNAQGHPISQEGCNPLINDLTGKIAVIYRNTCNFSTKALNAQNAGAIGVIIINRDPDLMEMGAGTDGANVTIPVVMLTTADGAALVNAMNSSPVNVSIGNFGSAICASNSNIATITLLSVSTSQSNLTICESELPYSWNGLTFNAAGSQTANLTNAAGCDSLATLILTVSPVSMGTDNITSCTPITWIDGNTYTSSNSTATFTIVGGSASGCDSLVTLNLTINPSVTPTFSQPSPICSGETLSALPTTSNEGITGTWSPALNNTTTTTYTFTPTAGQCASTATMTITVNPNVTPTFTAVSPICSGATLSALPTTSNNGITGTWSPALNNTATTTYTFTPTAGQCATTTTLTITVNPAAVIANKAYSICSGTSFTFVSDASDIIPSGTTYSWSAPVLSSGTTGGSAQTGVSTISQLLSKTSTTSGTATYTVSPKTGTCTGSSFTIVVTVRPIPVVTAKTVERCSGTSFTLSPTGVPTGTTYTWTAPIISPSGSLTGSTSQSTAQTSITQVLTNTTQSVATATYTVTPFNGTCAGNPFTLTATINPKPVIAAQSTAICSGGTFTVAPVGVPTGTTYTWTSPTITPSGTITGGSAQTVAQTTISQTLTSNVSYSTSARYRVTPKSGTCVGTAFFATVTVTPAVSLTANNTTICSGQTSTLTASSNQSGGTYNWSTGATTASITVSPTSTSSYTVSYSLGSCVSTKTSTVTVSPITPMPTTACYETATWNSTTCTWDVTGTQPAQPTTACYETATFNATTCTWDITGTQPAQPTTACYETATFNTATCAWDVIGTQPVQPATACYETANFNTATCSWDVIGTQPAQPTTACYETATFNTATCTWDVSGTQPVQPTTACYETAIFNTTTCTWDVTGTQPVQPATACYETATFNTATCTWDVTGTQPVQPTTACYETATFNTTTCTWDVTGTQPVQPATACYETANFNTATCSWDVTGTQPVQPTTACYETANFNTATCSWDVTGTQPVQPATACYETANFNTATCSWDVTGTQPVQPATACYETATFNTATCTWDVTGTQPVQPATACYETATFNTATCSWDVIGAQPVQPTTACYETATFNTTTCSWDVTGTQPVQPTTACYETATWNNTSCTWVVTGTQPAQPTTACYETATFNTTTCSWDVTGTQPVQPTTACYETANFNATTCTWDVTGTQPVQPTTACYETATFNTTTCSWDVTGTQPVQPSLACNQTASWNSSTCSWNVTSQPLLTPTFTQVDAICIGGTINLPSTSTNGITGSWSPALNNLATTTYTFTPTSGQCVSSTIVTMTVVVDQQPTLTVNSLTICESNTGVLTATPSISGGTYLWSTGATSQSITVADGGNYSVQYSSGTCNIQTNTQVVELPNTILNSTNRIICVGDTANLVVTANNTGGTYNWSNGDSGSSIFVTPTTNRTYTVTYVLSGCSNVTKSVTVTVNQVCTTKLHSNFCSSQNLTLSQNITCVYNLGYGHRYEVSLEDGTVLGVYDGYAASLQYTGRSPFLFRFNFLSNNMQAWCGLGAGKTYKVRVSWYNGSSWSNYGDYCTVGTRPEAVQVLQSFNGTTQSFGTEMNCNVNQMCGHRFQVSTLTDSIIGVYDAYATSQTISSRSRYNFRFSFVPNSAAKANTWYRIRVASYDGITQTWGEYGNYVEVKTPATTSTVTTISVNEGNNTAIEGSDEKFDLSANTGEKNYEISLYPNPTNDNIEIVIPIELIGKEFRLVDFTGRDILSGKLDSISNKVIMEQLSRGAYYFILADRLKVIKVIKQ